MTEPAYGEGWAAGYEHLSDNALERVLSAAEVADRIKVERDGQTAELWEVQSQGVKLRAVFKNVTAAPPSTTSPDPQPVDRYQHEIAAYRLDRQLGLRFVPVAIDREFEGRQGALRAVVETAIDAVSLRSYLNLETAETTALIRGVAQKYGVEQAELEEQVLRARVFDGLIGNLRRQPSDALFVVEEGRLALVNHQRRSLPARDRCGGARELSPASRRPCMR